MMKIAGNDRNMTDRNSGKTSSYLMLRVVLTVVLMVWGITSRTSCVYAQENNVRIVLDKAHARTFARQGDALKVRLIYYTQPFEAFSDDYSFIFSIDGRTVKTYTQRDWGRIKNSATEQNIDLPLPVDMAVGKHQLELVVMRNANGTQVEDARFSTSFRVYGDSFTRQKYLVEYHTATWCAYCPRTTAALMDVGKHCPDVAWVGIHSRDAFSVSGNAMLEKINGVTGYPNVYCDRRYIEEISGYKLGVWKADNQTSEEAAAVVYKYVSNNPMPALVSLDIVPTYNKEQRTLDIRVDLQSVPDFEEIFGPSALTVFLVEDSIPGLHNNVLRQVTSSPLGDPIVWQGTSCTKRYSSFVTHRWNERHVKVMAFVARQLDAVQPLKERGERYVTNTEVVPILPVVTTIDIDKPYESEKVVQAIYDAFGRRINQPSKGLNIVRYTDGSVVKKWIK